MAGEALVAIGRELDPIRLQNRARFFQGIEQRRLDKTQLLESMNEVNQRINTDPEFKKAALAVGKVHPGKERSLEAWARYTTALQAHNMNRETLKAFQKAGILPDLQAKAFEKDSILNGRQVSNQLGTLGGALLAKKKQDTGALLTEQAANDALKLNNVQAGVDMINSRTDLDAAQKNTAIARFSSLSRATQARAAAAGTGGLDPTLEFFASGVETTEDLDEILLKGVRIPGLKDRLPVPPGQRAIFIDRARKSIAISKGEAKEAGIRLDEQKGFSSLNSIIADTFGEDVTTDEVRAFFADEGNDAVIEAAGAA